MRNQTAAPTSATPTSTATITSPSDVPLDPPPALLAVGLCVVPARNTPVSRIEPPTVFVSCDGGGGTIRLHDWPSREKKRPRFAGSGTLSTALARPANCVSA